MNIKNTSKKKYNQKYETPNNVGEKGQLDMYQTNVKVNHYRRIKNFINIHIQMKLVEKDIYIDEEHTPANTVDFIKRLIKH